MMCVCGVGANKQRFCCIVRETAMRLRLGVYRSMSPLRYTRYPPTLLCSALILTLTSSISFALKLSKKSTNGLEEVKVKANGKKSTMQIGVCSILKRIFLRLWARLSYDCYWSAVKCDRHGFVYVMYVWREKDGGNHKHCEINTVSRTKPILQ